MPKVYSVALVGLSAEVVEIEADISSGLPNTIIVGLPDTSVQEARERVKSAVRNSGADYPRSRVAVNLAPADIPKNGSHYDLPIALSILLNARHIEFNPNGVMVMGELALHGYVRSVVGLLPAVLAAREKGFKKFLIPAGNAAEAALVGGIELIPIQTLAEAIAYLQGQIAIKPVELIDWSSVIASSGASDLDFNMISGQESAKRALEISAAGGHNLLMTGPPGTGKTLMAKALPSILPAMTVPEVLEVTKIYSVCGLLGQGMSMVSKRPFRSPHHSSSAASLVGGGTHPRPGEISLAHRGILFLDELPEFPRSVLENLRQPLEDGQVNVTRAAGSAIFPAQFILVAAQNPCPCGYKDHPVKPCTCSVAQIANYQRKVSGPLLDRIDMFIEVSRIDYDKLAGQNLELNKKADTKKNQEENAPESSKQVRARVEQARVIQADRFKQSKILTNSEMGIQEIRSHCALSQKENYFMRQAAEKMHLSARAYHRVLKLARTIADLDNQENLEIAHLAEALQYRTRSEQ